MSFNIPYTNICVSLIQLEQANPGTRTTTSREERLMKKIQDTGPQFVGEFQAGLDSFSCVFSTILITCVLYDNRRAFSIRPLINWSTGVSGETLQVS